MCSCYDRLPQLQVINCAGLHVPNFFEDAPPTPSSPGNAEPPKIKSHAITSDHCVLTPCRARVFCVPGAQTEPLRYVKLDMYDSKAGDEDLTWFAYAAATAVERERVAGGKTLVHCIQGVSRSCGLACAYLMWSRGLGFREALAEVKVHRPVAR